MGFLSKSVTLFRRGIVIIILSRTNKFVALQVHMLPLVNLDEETEVPR